MSELDQLIDNVFKKIALQSAVIERLQAENTRLKQALEKYKSDWCDKCFKTKINLWSISRWKY